MPSAAPIAPQFADSDFLGFGNAEEMASETALTWVNVGTHALPAACSSLVNE